ncbi:LacI family DNA-binding transcriptional regulator [Oceanicella sp. SM1341]|uniref:LacI family DNA-binding transcriptional regulator n=1 Tax=Oceanicella sp. SM1341 TaxID=1548889 RepID=UPI000E48DF1A|nr:LacI family DNA-binding transcriptional regulator [Oceanicella sp. SM1341]
MPSKAARIQDVALLAGVSTATVSRTLSRPDLVSEATRRAVHAAIEASGYRAPRGPHGGSSGGVVALVPGLSNPFFTRILSGMASVLTPAGYALLVADTSARLSEARTLLDYIDRGRADGIILLDGTLDPGLFAPAAGGRGLPPLVQACEWIEGLSAPRVRADNCDGAGLAVRHLARLGHRRIGHVTGPAGNVLTRARARGVQDALSALGLPRSADWVLPGDFTLDAGRRAARAWRTLPDRPTAMVFANDEMALGFVLELHAAGLDVPRDVSVVGFDDIELCGLLSPALTTLRQPRAELGAQAARALLDQIGQGPATAATALDILLPVQLLERESTAPPPPG